MNWAKLMSFVTFLSGCVYATPFLNPTASIGMFIGSGLFAIASAVISHGTPATVGKAATPVVGMTEGKSSHG
jgi:hypothetical protein